MRRRWPEWVALAVAAAIWWPVMHLCWRPDVSPGGEELDPIALPMARSLEEMWGTNSSGHTEIEPMRRINPEWDFMGRTFFILGEANLALRVPGREGRCLQSIDRLLADTLAMEQQHGMEHFLMDYHRARPWVEQPPASIFVDGEIALCLGARRLVSDDDRWRKAFRSRVGRIVERMNRGPVLCAESYPDECWMFCNTAAMAALRMAEVLDGEDHGALRAAWLRQLKNHLVDPGSGLLISAFQLDGTPHPAGPGPEGSTIWFAAHMLQVIDPGFAREQYDLAKRHLGRSLLGFGYSREWPGLALAGMDVDSGPVLPVLGTSASASGLALLGAAAFEDHSYYRQLRTSLEIGAFPRPGVNDAGDESLRYLMAGAIGDPVIFYSAVAGPLWDRLRPTAP
ncbi:MAG: hypothetical protein HKN82_01230 [Akkermansiaceae bacterium]|nr:hypothetical protein [Akkermansiaceae bacterium]NNM30304.1 hypothetical protein [Akkermansiaceae bacterium]